MNVTRGAILAIAMTMAGLVGLAKPAAAVTLVPPSLELSADPGDTIETKVKLFNETTSALTLTASSANFTAQGEEGEPGFEFDAPSADLAEWIKPGQASFDLEPGATIEIPVKIGIPANAEPGGHYAGLFFGSGAAAAEGGQVGIQSKIGTLVILRVSGNIREAGTVVEFGAAGGQSLNRLPVGLLLRIQNNGNVHFRPKGFVTIRNMFGGVSATLPINPKDGAVLPNSIRRFTMDWAREEGAAKGNFFAEVGREWRNFALGTYTAEAVMTYGAENRTLTATAKITVFPWHFLLVLLLGIIVVITLLVLGMRNYNRMIIKRAQGTPPSRPPAAPKG
jgi:hypothetical protein